MSPQVKIFSGQASRELTEKICDFFGSPLGQIELTKFSDGEVQVYYEESIRGSDLFLVQSTFSPAENLMELLLMVDAAKRFLQSTRRGNPLFWICTARQEGKV